MEMVHGKLKVGADATRTRGRPQGGSEGGKPWEGLVPRPCLRQLRCWSRSCWEPLPLPGQLRHPGVEAAGASGPEKLLRDRSPTPNG